MNDTPIDPKEQAQRLGRALAALQKMRAKIEEMERRASEPIAVVGMACRFPGGADSPEAFWRLLRDGADVVTEVPRERWDAGAYHSPDPAVPGRIASRFGSFLEGIHGMDARCFNLSPREAAAVDPQQKLLLEVCWEALEAAGLSPELLEAGPTGLFIGMNTSDYLLNQIVAGDPADLDFYLATGNTHSVATGRVSQILGLRGPSMAIDTACSSSLTAVHLACQSLRTGECRAALAGGVNLTLAPEVSITISSSRVFAPDGRCKTFDAAADGYVRGEGCGVVVLKRLSDALADGDTVLARIVGSAVNHGGVTVPHGPSQEAVIRAALRAASLDPGRLDYVEAHGTGTALGDPIEVRALAAALGPGRSPDRPLWLGSVKTNMGHLEAAAGVAGLMKVILSLCQKEIPPHLHFRRWNPLCEVSQLALDIPTSVVPWPSHEDRPRTAGVSSFGIGGTNAHVIVEEAPSAPAAAHSPPPRRCLLPLSARSAESLRRLAAAHRTALAAAPPGALRDVCYTASVRRAHHEHRLAVTGATPAEMAAALGAHLAGADHPDVTAGQAAGPRREEVVFVFTGQGAEWVRWSRDLMQEHPVFKDGLSRCDAAVRRHGGPGVLARIDSGDASGLDAEGDLRPILFSVEVALAGLWRSWGVEPDAVIGRGAGEIAAAHVAGALALDDAAQAVCAGGRPPAGGGAPVEATGRIPILGPDAGSAAGAGRFEVALLGPGRRGERGPEATLASLGALYALGYPVRWRAVLPAGGRVAALPRYPFVREEHVRVRQRGGPADPRGAAAARPATGAAAPAGGALLAELWAAPEAEREGVVLRHLRVQSARVLSLSPEFLDVNEPVARLGMTSLMVFDLKNWVKAATSVSVPVETFSPAASVRDLARDITRRVIEAGPPAGGAPGGGAGAPEKAASGVAAPAGAKAGPPGGTARPEAKAAASPGAAGAGAAARGGTTLTVSETAWLVPLRSTGGARLRLFCFPFAGAGASVFQSWPEGLPADVDVWAVQPPGRDRRLTEPPIRQLSVLVRHVADALGPRLSLPFAFFGHSLGGLVSHEVARELRRRGAPGPTHLFVSASRAPQIPDLKPPSHRLPDDRFIAEVQKLGGMPEELLSDRELLQVFLPALRADFAMLETYVHLREEPLSCPITAFEGASDATVHGEQVEGWREMTRGAFDRHVLPGGHFFLAGERTDLLARITAALSPAPGGAPHRDAKG